MISTCVNSAKSIEHGILSNVSGGSVIRNQHHLKSFKAIQALFRLVETSPTPVHVPEEYVDIKTVTEEYSTVVSGRKEHRATGEIRGDEVLQYCGNW